MEFKDIENIHKDVIVKVKDILNLTELLPYMEAYFTPMTIQGIRADLKNHGPSYATTNHLFDSVKRKPPSFYRMLAALRHIKQQEVYAIYEKSLQKYFKNDKDKLGKVLSLIEAQFDELERNHDNEHHDGDDGDESDGGDGRVQIRTSSRGASGNSGTGNQECGGSGGDWESITTDRSSIQQSDKDNYHPPPPPPPPAASAVAYRTVASKSPVTAGRTSPDNENLSFTTNTVPSQLDPRYAGAPLSSLDAGVYSQLGQALEVCGRSGKPWWDHIIITSGNLGINLGISRREQKRIGNEVNPGIELLDVLDMREFTLRNLEDLLLRCNVDKPLNILRQIANKVIVDKQTENNLNMNISKKQDTEKDINFGSKSEFKQNNEDGGSSNYSQTDISGPDSNASFTTNESSLSLDGDDNSIKGTQAIQPCGERETEDTAQQQGHESSNNSPISNQEFISVGAKPNQVSNDDPTECKSRGNESPKGTRAVKVHEDSTGEKAQHEPGRDAMKLQYDCIHQFDVDPQALEDTSFIPVGQSNSNKSNACEQAVSDQATAMSLQDSTQNEVNVGESYNIPALSLCQNSIDPPESGENQHALSLCQNSIDPPESGENQHAVSAERDGNIPNNLDSLNTNSNPSLEN